MLVRVKADDPKVMGDAVVLVMKYARTHITEPFTFGPFNKEQIMKGGLELTGTPTVLVPIIYQLKASLLPLDITAEH